MLTPPPPFTGITPGIVGGLADDGAGALGGGGNRVLNPPPLPVVPPVTVGGVTAVFATSDTEVTRACEDGNVTVPVFNPPVVVVAVVVVGVVVKPVEALVVVSTLGRESLLAECSGNKCFENGPANVIAPTGGIGGRKAEAPVRSSCNNVAGAGRVCGTSVRDGTWNNGGRPNTVRRDGSCVEDVGCCDVGACVGGGACCAEDTDGDGDELIRPHIECGGTNSG